MMAAVVYGREVKSRIGWQRIFDQGQVSDVYEVLCISGLVVGRQMRSDASGIVMSPMALFCERAITKRSHNESIPH